MQNVLGNELVILEKRPEVNPQSARNFLRTLRAHLYSPEDMSDTDNLVAWTRLIRLFNRFGLTATDFQTELGVSPMELQQWLNGVQMPTRIQLRKDMVVNMTTLLAARI